MRLGWKRQEAANLGRADKETLGYGLRPNQSEGLCADEEALTGQSLFVIVIGIVVGPGIAAVGLIAIAAAAVIAAVIIAVAVRGAIIGAIIGIGRDAAGQRDKGGKGDEDGAFFHAILLRSGNRNTVYHPFGFTGEGPAMPLEYTGTFALTVRSGELGAFWP